MTSHGQDHSGRKCCENFYDQATSPYSEDSENDEDVVTTEAAKRMRLGCGVVRGSGEFRPLGIPQLVARQWRQEHGRKQGSPGEPQKGREPKRG